MPRPPTSAAGTGLAAAVAAAAGFVLGVGWLQSLPSGGDVGSIKLLLLPAPFVLATIAAGSVVLAATLRGGGLAAAAWVLACAVVAGPELVEARRPPPAPAVVVPPSPTAAPAPREHRRGYRPPARLPPTSDAILHDLDTPDDPARRGRALGVLAADPGTLDDLRDERGALPDGVVSSLQAAVRASEADRRRRRAAGEEVADGPAAVVRDRVLLREALMRAPLPEFLSRRRSPPEDRALLAGLAAGWLEPMTARDGALEEADARALEAWLVRAAASEQPELAWEGKIALEVGLPGLPAPRPPEDQEAGVEEEVEGSRAVELHKFVK